MSGSDSDHKSDKEEYYYLDPAHTDPKRLRKERLKSQELKKSQWWKSKLAQGVCHYCHQKFSARDLTMDHLVPLARGGSSNKGNVVPACKPCNQNKKLHTPVDEILRGNP